MQVIGVHPQRGSHTAVAIGVDEKVSTSVRVESSLRQVDGLLAFAQWPVRVCAVEGAPELGVDLLAPRWHLLASAYGLGFAEVDSPERVMPARTTSPQWFEPS